MRYIALPRSGLGKRQRVVDTFGGLNRQPDPELGQWADERNLSSARYPRLTVRPAGATVQTLGGSPADDVVCMSGGDELAVLYRIHGGTAALWAGGNSVTVYETAQDIPSRTGKQVVRMGAWAILFPDGFFVNAVKLASGAAMSLGRDYGFINKTCREAEPETGDAPVVRLLLCDSEGNVQEGAVASESEPQNPQTGDLWIDTSVEPHLLKQYLPDGTWWERRDTCVAICIDGISFDIGDWVTVKADISQCVSAIDPDAARSAMDLLQGEHEVVSWALSKPVTINGTTVYVDCIVVDGIIDADIIEITLQGDGGVYAGQYVEVSHTVPQMDYVVECGNRLWGCFSGTADGQLLNELYASKLGDFKNWRAYNGLSTASWTASRGSDGPWTGAAVLDGKVLFFREGCVDKIFPSSTGAHQVLTQSLDGVEDGAWRTLTVIDNVLYYKAIPGVMRYAGTMPQLISETLGAEHLIGQIAGRHGDLYCIAMQRRLTDALLWYVYDTTTGIWHTQTDDSEGAGYAATYRRRLYYVGDSPAVWAFDAGNGAGAAPDGVQWYAQTGEIGWRNLFARVAFKATAREYAARIFVRWKLGLGAAVRLLISYDDGPWVRVHAAEGCRMSPGVAMITPRRCDQFRLRLEGVGVCEVQSVAFELRTGGERH